MQKMFHNLFFLSEFLFIAVVEKPTKKGSLSSGAPLNKTEVNPIRNCCYEVSEYV